MTDKNGLNLTRWMGDRKRKTKSASKKQPTQKWTNEETIPLMEKKAHKKGCKNTKVKPNGKDDGHKRPANKFILKDAQSWQPKTRQQQPIWINLIKPTAKNWINGKNTLVRITRQNYN